MKAAVVLLGAALLLVPAPARALVMVLGSRLGA